MRRQRTDVVEEMAVALRTSGVLPGKDLDWLTTLQPMRTVVKGGGFKVRHKPRLFSVKRRPYSDIPPTRSQPVQYVPYFLIHATTPQAEALTE